MGAEGLFLKCIKRRLAALLAAFLCLALCGCKSQVSDPYRVLKTLGGDNCHVAFRKDDRIGQWVIAAMNVLAADGTMAELSRAWFGSDLTMMRGDKDALNDYNAERETREVVIGIDFEVVKLTEGSNGDYKGFDIDLAEAVCDLLGWGVSYREIRIADAKVELNAGQVDMVWCGFSDSSLSSVLQLSPAYLQNTYVVVSRSDSKITRFGQVDEVTVGITENSGEYATVMNDALASSKITKNNILFCDSQESCFAKLNSGKCEVIVVSQRLLGYHNSQD